MPHYHEYGIMNFKTLVTAELHDVLFIKILYHFMGNLLKLLGYMRLIYKELFDLQQIIYNHWRIDEYLAACH